MFSRKVLDALFPNGAFWTPASGDDYDLLLDGVSENSDIIKSVVDLARNIRNPYLTPVLSDLEKEYAVFPLPTSTETTRRSNLAARIFKKKNLPTYESLQSVLREAGFDVYVHANDPAVDPATFLLKNFQMVAGEALSQCGEPDAYCGIVGGELLVNGAIFDAVPNYTALCDEAEIQCGEDAASAGEYDSIRLVEKEYEIPTDAGLFPLIFFVGGLATRDPITNEITNIDVAQIPVARKSEFKRLILSIKPLFSWAGLIVTYT